MKQTNVLMLRCPKPKCREEFRSPIQGNIQSLVQSALINNPITCPKCQMQFLTSKPDFFYYDENGNEQPISFRGSFNG